MSSLSKAALCASVNREIFGEEAMVAFGKTIGQLCQGMPLVIFLEGNLGMGKTTLSRGVLFAYGHTGAVKSPTYTLVEPYEFSAGKVFHFDLYRLEDINEAYNFGIEEYLDSDNWKLIEWPEKIESILFDDYNSINIEFDNLNNRLLKLN